MVATAALYFHVSLVALVAIADAGDFLSQKLTRELVEQTLFSEMASAAGSARIAAIERELSPMYSSLPKNIEGQVESSVVRYALHRYFVHKHGWYVKGLSPWEYRKSSTEDTSAEFVTELAPAYIQDLLAKQMEHEGMQIRDLAVFAATMEDLIHADGMKNLFAVYERLGMPSAQADSMFLHAMRGYLSAIVIGFDTEVSGVRSIAPLEAQAREVYPEYDDLLMWIEDTRLDHRFLGRSDRNPFIVEDDLSFDEVDRLMHSLYHHFGTVNNRECMTLREGLLEDEYPGTGRVPLSKFYASTENNLQESVDYLRNTGALDEAQPNNPTVVIPNYLSSPARCMPFSSYFSVCCPDTCESILREVETSVAEPVAEPKRLAEIVSGISSETQQAPQNLSPLLLSRLEEIGGYHHGQIPLHGRLFMQWLHHAFPRECPYPHVSGTVTPVSQEEWILMNSEIDTVTASDAEKQAHLSTELQWMSTEHLPWTEVEELVAVRNKPAAKKQSFLRPVVMIIAVLSFALPLSRGSLALLSTDSSKSSMHLV